MGRIRFVGSKVQRSTVSCLECRRRKKKCDEKRPCGGCKKRNVHCVDKVIDKGNVKREVMEEKVDDEDKEDDSNSVLTLIDSNQLVVKFNTDDYTPLDNINSFYSFKFGKDLSPLLSPILSPKLIQILGSDNLKLPDPISNFTLSPAMKIDTELEVLARNIVDKFQLSNKLSDIYHNTYRLLLPISFKSKIILITLCSLVLSITEEIDATIFLDYSQKLTEELGYRIDYVGGWNEDDLIEFIVCLSCHTIIAGICNDTLLWKTSFETLYHTLKKIGLEMFITLIHKSNNKHIFKWVVNLFFYQDVCKIIKVTQNKKLGPMFSKAEYLKFIHDHDHNNDNDNDNKGDTHDMQLTQVNSNSGIFSVCLNLYVVLGEVNALYDQFSVRIQRLIDRYYNEIKPILDNITDPDDQINFANTKLYLDYEKFRSDFHYWVQDKTYLLEQRIKASQMNSNENTPPDFQTCCYFDLMKMTVLLYMKFKIKELPATSYEIKNLVLLLFGKFRTLLLYPNFHSHLLFPLLILGANVCEERDRVMIRGFYKSMTQQQDNSLISSRRSLSQIWIVLQEFWRLNPNGVSFDMWQNIINKYEWDICIV